MLKMVLFDRDNTMLKIPPGVKYQSGEDELEFSAGAVECIRLLNARQIWVIVITNQRAVALTEYPGITVESVHRYHERMQNILQKHFARIDGFYFCPHDDKDNCLCRKPKPGLVIRALQNFRITGSQAVLIGDTQRDIIAGESAGVTCFKFDPAVQNLLTLINQILESIN